MEVVRHPRVRAHPGATAAQRPVPPLPDDALGVRHRSNGRQRDVSVVGSGAAATACGASSAVPDRATARPVRSGWLAALAALLAARDPPRTVRLRRHGRVVPGRVLHRPRLDDPTGRRGAHRLVVVEGSASHSARPLPQVRLQPDGQRERPVPGMWGGRDGRPRVLRPPDVVHKASRTSTGDWLHSSGALVLTEVVVLMPLAHGPVIVQPSLRAPPGSLTLRRNGFR